jgi:hypothetical protein
VTPPPTCQPSEWDWRLLALLPCRSGVSQPSATAITAVVSAASYPACPILPVAWTPCPGALALSDCPCSHVKPKTEPRACGPQAATEHTGPQDSCRLCLWLSLGPKKLTPCTEGPGSSSPEQTVTGWVLGLSPHGVQGDAQPRTGDTAFPPASCLPPD